MSTDKVYEVVETGVFTPALMPLKEGLSAGKLDT